MAFLGVRTERMAKEKSKGAAATVVLARIPRGKWIMMQMMSRCKTRMVEMGANELAIRLCCAAMRFMHAFNVSFTQIVRRFHRSSNVSSACGVPMKIALLIKKDVREHIHWKKMPMTGYQDASSQTLL